MNIAEFSIKKKVITWLLIIILIAGGIFAYQMLGRFEDPEFTIKDAVIKTEYPGATPKEVEEEVTDKVERAAQQLSQLKRIKSISTPGLSEITVTIKDKYDKNSLPQVWDELRRKVNDIQAKLPPGAHRSVVNDDFGDVYGMLYAVTGDGFSYKDLKEYTKDIERELLLVPGVAKVQVSGRRQEAIFVDISRSRMAQLGISQEQIYDTLKSQNEVVKSGYVRVGDEYIRISPTGNLSSVETIGNILLKSNKTNKLIHLDDIAKVSRSYIEVPDHLDYYNGKPALMLGVSIASGGNVVKIGRVVDALLEQMQAVIPVGVSVHQIYNQPTVVQQSVRGFLISLLEALAIVVIVLLLFMGLRSGLIIAAILLITVLGTLLFMYVFNISLQRISLGALIIALGMLVDNAIVVTEGILIKVQQGIDAIKASKDVVKQTMWPLFGATLVGVLAFAAIGLSQDSTGEYTRSLLSVIFISLMLSWLLAIMVAPLFCYLFLKPKPKDKQQQDPYGNVLYRGYKGFLNACIRVRWLTVLVMIGLLVAAMIGFGYVKQSFFPNSTTPIFLVDYWRAEGTDIRATAADMQAISQHIQSLPDVTAVSFVTGSGAQRFMLVYEPEKQNSAYGQFIVSVKDYREIPKISAEVKDYIISHYPNTEPKIKFIRLGPGGGAKIEARFSGPNPNVLRQLSAKAKAIMRKDPGAVDIRDDWRQQVKIISPVYSESQARLTGISRVDLSDALQTAFTGKYIGLYREEDELIPIISRPPDEERLNVANIEDVQIWSPLLNKMVPVGQMVTSFNTNWENARIYRRNRKPTITVSCEPRDGLASDVFNRIRPEIEAIALPVGYQLEWGGEYENSHDAQTALAAKLPLSFLAMIIVVILLFGKIRQPLIIWLTVPLSIIGVTVGLLVTHQEFGFMALLGFLSLTGMLIKNAIVLVDQIDLEVSEGKPLLPAILDSSVSRMRPVMLAAITTVLGMIPLLMDAFFVSMAVVIMFGLAFATVLTLIVVPVLYAIFFRAKK